MSRAFSDAGVCKPGSYNDYASYEVAARLSGTAAAPFPAHVDVEPTNRCNFNCTFCDKQQLIIPGGLGDMDPVTFRKIADECGAFGLASMSLSYRGEPLLNNNLPGFIEYAKKGGVKRVSICTNAMLLVPGTAWRLIEAGLDEITVSVQGAAAETFEYERFGARFDTVVRNIESLMRLRDETRACLYVRTQAVSLAELDEVSLRGFWSARCDEVSVIPYREPGSREKGIITGWACRQPWQRIAVEWDGTILPCGNDDIKEYSPGNIKATSIYEAWRGPRLKMIRDAHTAGASHTISDCDGCFFRRCAIKRLTGDAR